MVTVAAAFLWAQPLSGQVQWQDLVFTGGFSVEGYRGNFSAVTVPVVDSTNAASATVGEFATRGAFALGGSGVVISFDGGLRQFAARGFHLRDYAPREWVGRVDAHWTAPVGSLGVLNLGGTARGRTVEDRPPMPLFLQPGYDGYRGRAAFDFRPVQDVRFDVTVDLQQTDFDAPQSLPQLDLLDRRSRGVEAGARFGRDLWTVRFYTGYRESEFPDQPSFDAADPFRRDHLVQVGGSWTVERGAVFGEMGVEGTVNRSNSKRPEYDAFTARGILSSPLPWSDLQVNLLAVLTGKTYVHEVPFTRLVPGEEADAASIVYAELVHPLSPELNGALRFGWTRAETEIGDAYYSRYGMTVLMHYRPAGL